MNGTRREGGDILAQHPSWEVATKKIVKLLCLLSLVSCLQKRKNFAGLLVLLSMWTWLNLTTPGRGLAFPGVPGTTPPLWSVPTVAGRNVSKNRPLLGFRCLSAGSPPGAWECLPGQAAPRWASFQESTFFARLCWIPSPSNMHF